MSSHNNLITLVVELREAQKEDKDLHTQKTYVERMRCEARLDDWIDKYMAEIVQLELWKGSSKTDETPGVYNVTDESETEEGSAA